MPKSQQMVNKGAIIGGVIALVVGLTTITAGLIAIALGVGLGIGLQPQCSVPIVRFDVFNFFSPLFLTRAVFFFAPCSSHRKTKTK